MEEETDDDLSVAARYAEGISYNVNAIVSTGATVRAFPMDSESSSSESDGEPENAVAGDSTAFSAAFSKQNEESKPSVNKESMKVIAKEIASVLRTATEPEEDPANEPGDEDALPDPQPMDDITIDANASIQRIGTVVDVAKEGPHRYRAIILAEDQSSLVQENSLLCSEMRVPLGHVAEIFGPIKRPFYALIQVQPSPTTQEEGVRELGGDDGSDNKNDNDNKKATVVSLGQGIYAVAEKSTPLIVDAIVREQQQSGIEDDCDAVEGDSEGEYAHAAEGIDVDEELLEKEALGLIQPPMMTVISSSHSLTSTHPSSAGSSRRGAPNSRGRDGRMRGHPGTQRHVDSHQHRYQQQQQLQQQHYQPHQPHQPHYQPQPQWQEEVPMAAPSWMSPEYIHTQRYGFYQPPPPFFGHPIGHQYRMNGRDPEIMGVPAPNVTPFAYPIQYSQHERALNYGHPSSFLPHTTGPSADGSGVPDGFERVAAPHQSHSPQQMVDQNGYYVGPSAFAPPPQVAAQQPPYWHPNGSDERAPGTQ